MGISWEWYRLVSWQISGVFEGNCSGDQSPIYQLTMIYLTLKIWGVPWCTPLSIFEWNISEHVMLRVSIIYSMGISGDQWPFQVPKLEVRTIYKAYVYGLNVRGDASKIWDQWYTVIYGDTWWYMVIHGDMGDPGRSIICIVLRCIQALHFLETICICK